MLEVIFASELLSDLSLNDIKGGVVNKQEDYACCKKNNACNVNNADPSYPEDEPCC